MKNLLCLLFLMVGLVLANSPLFAQNAGFGWSKQYGSPGQDYGNSIARDANGNLYMTGGFLDSTTIGSFTLTSPGWYNAYLAKLDSAGNIIWVKHFSTDFISIASELQLDAQSNIFVAGLFGGDMTIGSLSLSSPYTPSSGARAFVVKFDSSGQEIWARKSTPSGTMMSEQANGLTVDATGNAYITGIFSDTISFGNITITGPDTDTGLFNGFVVKYDQAGNEMWAQSYGGENDFIPRSIVADNSGNIYVTGSFRPIFPSTSISVGGQTLVANGDEDIFMMSLNPAGNLNWVFRTGGSFLDTPYQLTIDQSNNLYLVGTFWNDGIFGTDTLYADTTSAGFIASYTSGGSFRWARQETGSGHSAFSAISADNLGNLFVTGSYEGSITIGNQSLTAAGFNEAFMASYDSLGNEIWAISTGGDNLYSVAGGSKIISDGSGWCYVMGNFHDKLAFGLDSLSTGNSYQNNIFISRISQGPFLRTASPGFNQSTPGAQIIVPFRSEGSFNNGNQFIAQLSDANGSFSSPVNIGSLTGGSNNYITAQIPAATATGNHYRLRVVATSPALIAPDNGYDIKIGNFTSTGQNQNQNTVQVFPNPFHNTIIIHGLTKNQSAHIRLFDLMGKEVFSRQYSVSDSTQAMPVDVNQQLPSGVYFLQVQQSETVLQHKLVKQ